MESFVISVIGESDGVILSRLTGVEFSVVTDKLVTIGVNYVPMPQDRLVNIIGLLYTSQTPMVQAIAFLSAVLASNIVIVNICDLAAIWTNVQFCCDVISERIQLVWQEERDVIVLGKEIPFDLTGVPESSALHFLLRICRFHFFASAPDFEKMTEVIKANAGFRPTRDAVALIRRATAIAGANHDRPGGLVQASDVFELSEEFRTRPSPDLPKATWLCKLAADAGDRNARYSLASIYGAGEYLQQAADHGHPEAQFRIFLADSSKIDYLVQAAAAGYSEAVFKLASVPEHSESAIRGLLLLQELGNTSAKEALFQFIDQLPPRTAMTQARLWLPTDPMKALACYQAARRSLPHDFRLYRSILVACNLQFPSVQDESEAGLRAALANDNKLAAAKLAELITDPAEKLAILEQGIPAASAFFGLISIYALDLEENGDRLYECSRDGILASPSSTPDCHTTLDQLYILLEGDEFSDPVQKRVEIANLLFEGFDSPFTKGQRDPEVFIIASDDDPPEILAVRARMASTVFESKNLLKTASRKVGKIDSRLKGEIRWLQYENSKSPKRLKRAAVCGISKAQVAFAFAQLEKPEIDSGATDLVVRCVLETSEEGSSLGAQYLHSLALWNGAFGIESNRPRAEVIWRTISLEEMEKFPVVRSNQLATAQSEFIHTKWAMAESEEEVARAISALVERIQADNHFQAVLLKQLYLGPESRFNAVKCMPKHLTAFKRALTETRQHTLFEAVNARIGRESPEYANPTFHEPTHMYHERYSSLSSFQQ
jgi:hypothetical protein